ncbi:B12-binding domain-containing radical SAM protein [Petrachloros mirabilis]
MDTQTVLLLIPPLTQLNTPYPSTAYLTGFLRSRNIDCHQADIGIEMVLRLFSRTGLKEVFREVRALGDTVPPEAARMLRNESRYLMAIGPVIRFLQSRRPASASQILALGYLPRGPRSRNRMGRRGSKPDRAIQAATFFLEDLTDLIHATVSPHFGLSRYAEHIARAASSFDQILNALTDRPTLTDRYMLDAMWRHINRVNPTLVGLSVPFPGNLYGAFRMAQDIKRLRPDIRIVLGGGYANTELRRVSDPRVFDFVDFITLDDGERPFLSLIEYLSGTRPKTALTRTSYREKDRVVYQHDPSAKNFHMSEIGCPTYDGLTLNRYLTILDSTNPMHRLWSEGHWNKLTVAHGCYWKQCTFCDVGLDYIGRYEMTPTEHLIRQIEQLIAETGKRGFHFVDEAAPPAALKSLALGLLERKIKIRWWGNIRFEEAFTPDLCRLLAASGCIAVSAGLEAASDRLLEKMKKGITVDQTALVASAFKQAGILIHAYLMYGFPSETIQETIDSLERVRQLFKTGLVQSAFWHRFTVTAHSPIGLHPSAHGLRILGPEFQGFAENDLDHRDSTGRTPDWLGEGLRRSMLNYLEGRGLDMDVRGWFDHHVPKPRVNSNWIRGLLTTPMPPDDPKRERHLVWLGERPEIKRIGTRVRIRLAGQSKHTYATLSRNQAQWLTELLQESTPSKPQSRPYPLLREAQALFPGSISDFAEFLKTSQWTNIRRAGFLLV